MILIRKDSANVKHESLIAPLRDEQGLTLIEILAVVMIIGLIYVVVAKGVFSRGETAKANLNVARMQRVKSAIEQYRLQFNRYPAALQDLMKKPSDLPSDQIFNPLLSAEELKDVWDRDLLYQVEGGGRSYRLTSYGADGLPGGEGPDQDVTLKP